MPITPPTIRILTVPVTIDPRKPYRPIPQYSSSVQFVPSQVARKSTALTAVFDPFADDSPGSVPSSGPPVRSAVRAPLPAPPVSHALSQHRDVTMKDAPVMTPARPLPRASPSPPPVVDQHQRLTLSAADARARLVASMILYKGCAGRKGKSPMKLGYVPSGLSQVVCCAA